MSGARELAIPWNGVGREAEALDERPVHVAVAEQRVDDVARVVAIGGAKKAPVAGVGVHLDFGEAAADAAVHRPPDRSGMDACAFRANRPTVRLGQRRERDFRRWIVLGRDDAVPDRQRRGVDLQRGRGALQQILPQLVGRAAERAALQLRGEAAVPAGRRRRQV